MSCRCAGVRATGPRTCQNIWTDRPVQRPDLAIYSQIESLAAGTPPTWDNPDIVTNRWSPFRLIDTAEATIRNLSNTVPAINALVHYYVSPFGIGTRRTLMLSKKFNLAPASAITLTFPLDRPTLDGDPRVGVHFVLEHPTDANPLNNVGSQVHDGGFTRESGRDFVVELPVMNDSATEREIRLNIMPTEMLATISPGTITLGAFEQAIVMLRIKVPDFLSGTREQWIQKAVTVVGRLATGELVGGVTRLIRIDD